MLAQYGQSCPKECSAIMHACLVLASMVLPGRFTAMLRCRRRASALMPLVMPAGSSMLLMAASHCLHAAPPAQRQNAVMNGRECCRYLNDPCAKAWNKTLERICQTGPAHSNQSVLCILHQETNWMLPSSDVSAVGLIFYRGHRLGALSLWAAPRLLQLPRIPVLQPLQHIPSGGVLPPVSA